MSLPAVCRRSRLLFLVLGLATNLVLAADDHAAGGTVFGIFRYRFDDYDQDTVKGAPITAVGKASTLRIDVGYLSAGWNGFTVLAEFNNVSHLGDNAYRIPTIPDQNRVGYPTINDPAVNDLHQLELRWSMPGVPVSFKVGRDELQLNNGRFLGNSLWRQTPQTVDLAQVNADLGHGVTASYTYFDRVHRTVGKDATDGALTMNSDLANLVWTKPGIAAISAYGLRVDYDRPDQWVNSTETTGVRATGPYKVNRDFAVIYTLDWAHQSNIGHNPNHVSVDYWTCELGGQYRGESLFLGWTVLGAHSATDKLSTPLSPPFNGWVEKFGPNPAVAAGAGLNIRYATLTGPVPGVAGLTHTLTYYQYYADTTGAHFGDELDLGGEWKATPIDPRLTFGVRCGDYHASALYTHSVRTAVYATFKF